MQLPVHKENLLPRGKRIGKYIYITHKGDYAPGWVEVWKHFFGPWYYWKETRIPKK